MMNFKQWLMEMDAGHSPGESRPDQGQLAATADAKAATAEVLTKKPEMAAKLVGGGPTAKKVQTNVSAQIASSIGKTSGNKADPIKAAFSGVDSVIGDLENSVGESSPKMMKKGMKK
jgi:hypothetical protein